MRTFLATALLVAISADVSAGTVYYMDLVNRGPSAIVAFDANVVKDDVPATVTAPVCVRLPTR